MLELLSRPAYEEAIAKSRDERMRWWREARFGMFVHYGLYTVLARHEWAMAFENWSIEDYEKLADQFLPKPGAPREWARLAKAAGMKYMVMTTRHHEGFSLWDSKVNAYNSVNFGPKRDIVQEFVDACREFGLGIGFYSSLMDWHHPDGGRAAYDSAARKRFNDYIYALNEELLTNYGKIDVLWFDVAEPMESAEGWNALEMNQKLRALQPHIIINDRSRLPEDFGTPEEHLTAEAARDWEACMTFNGISWGYIDSAQATPYSYNAQRILRMLFNCASDAGNLLLNIGPMPDGSVPPEAFEPLETVGRWLKKNGECVYGIMTRCNRRWFHGTCSISKKGNTAYLWNWIWPADGQMIIGGLIAKLKRARLVSTNEELCFTQEKYRIIFDHLPENRPDCESGVSVIALDFETEPQLMPFAKRPPLNAGRIYE